MQESIEKSLKNKKILFATVAGEGHINPLTDLAHYLISVGCDVRWYTSEGFRAKIEKLGARFYPYYHAPDINGSNLDELFPERAEIVDPGAKADFDMGNLFARLAPGAFQDIAKIEGEFDFDIMIADSVFSAIPLVRAKLNKPVLAIGVVPLAEESNELGPYGPGFYPPESQAQREHYAELRHIFTTVVFKNSIETFSEILTAHGVEHEKSTLFDTLIRHADLYLQIGTPSFEYQRGDLGTNIRFIGALLPYTDPEKVKPWSDPRLDQYSQIVLVTQGTVERDVSKLLEPTLEAFAGTDTLVIATTAGNQTEELRKKYPHENLIIEDYIPFDQVMTKASVFVTNGGYSGTLLSIKNKLPMVACGVHEGKAEICSRIGHFKYGIDLKTETPTAEMIRRAVSSLLASNFYQRNVDSLATEIARYNAKELCASYISELIASRQVVA